MISGRKITYDSSDNNGHPDDWQMTDMDNDMAKVTMTRRFYVGSEGIVGSNYLGTLSEATARARKLVEEDGDSVRYVVEVVRIVKSKPIVSPIVIEDVRRD